MYIQLLIVAVAMLFFGFIRFYYGMEYQRELQDRKDSLLYETRGKSNGRNKGS